LLKASLEVFLLLLLFMSFQDLGGGFGEIALGVGISDTYINDAISTAVPKTTDTYFSSDFTSVLACILPYCTYHLLTLLARLQIPDAWVTCKSKSCV
jgi:hypothetical protein